MGEIASTWRKAFWQCGLLLVSWCGGGLLLASSWWYPGPGRCRRCRLVAVLAVGGNMRKCWKNTDCN